jgi:hypothetical protein
MEGITLSGMDNLMNFPFLIALVSFVIMWGTAYLGTRIFNTTPKLEGDERDNFSFIIGASLTLLGLIIGFSFSMATGRYDQRKNYEEEEANAIGTEYVRVEVLPSTYPEKLQALLSKYLQLRIQFYQVRNQDQLRQIDADTAQLQNEMWAAVKAGALVNPTQVAALAVSGMNDVLNRQGYTQAMWWNRIPIAAWGLMAAIAICCNLMIGFAGRHAERRKLLLLVLPLVLSISFLLLADLDSPRGGIIRVQPQNLLSLAQSMHS